MTETDLFGQQLAFSEPIKKSKTISFDNVIGQEKIKKHLEKAITDKRIPKAYLFYGPEGTGKDAMAIEFGKALNCRAEDCIPCHKCDDCRLIGQLLHPDFKFVFAAPGKIKESDFVNHLKEKSDKYYIRSA